MLKIRLQRTGRKHETTFRVVLTDSKNSTKSGKYKEMLGSYDPRKDNTTSLKADRIKHWLSVGAEASGTVHNLLLSEKVIQGKKINVLPKKTIPKKEEAEAESKPNTEAAEEAKSEASASPESIPTKTSSAETPSESAPTSESEA